MKMAIAIIFIWAGFILSISFFESWVKFRAAGVSVPVALSIGKLIFTVLNRIEWVFAVFILVSLILSKTQLTAMVSYMMVSVVIILLLQTFWMLPELNTRVANRINGIKLAPSYLHHYFVVGEIVKLILLLIVGAKLLNLSFIK